MAILDIYRSGDTYYGPYGRSSDLFATLWGQVLADAKHGDTIEFLSGNYVLDQKIIGKSGVSVLMDSGALLDCTTLPMNYSDYIMKTDGNYGAGPSNMVGVAAQGEMELTVMNGSLFKAGDMILINSNQIWEANEISQLQGELRYIAYVDGDTLHLTEPLYDTYMTIGNIISKVRQILPVKSITLKNMNVKGLKGQLLHGFYFVYGDDITIDGFYSDGVDLTATGFLSVINSSVKNSQFWHANTDGFGYGVALSYASANILVENVTGVDCRHVIAVGGGPSDFGGIPRHLTLQYNKSYDSGINNLSSAAFDAHPVGEYIDYLYNEVYGGVQGFWAAAHRMRVIGNLIQDVSNRGISMKGVNYKDILLQDNKIIRAGANGYNLEEAPNTLVKGGEVRNSGGNGISVQNVTGKFVIDGVKISGSGDPAVSWANNIEVYNSKGVEIKNSIFRMVSPDYPARTAYSGVKVNANCLSILIHDNDFLDSGYAYLLWDSSVNGVTHYNNLGIIPSDFNTYALNYRSNPILVNAIINGFVVPSGTSTQFPLGDIITLQFQKRVVI